jgi:hypothetical protein
VQTDLASQAVQQELQSQYQQQLKNKQIAYQSLLVRAYGLDEESLRAELTNKSSARRLTAAYVVGERQLPWIADLLDRLTDSNALVRQAARRSLVILSYFALQSSKPNSAVADDSACDAPIVDFGPQLNGDRVAQERAASEWKDWWDRQAPGADKKRSALSSVAAGGDIDAEASRLKAGLVFAPPERQAAKLAEYRDAKGIVYTEAMTDALPQLTGEMLVSAREALAQRLARMTATTLSDRLSDPRPEMRRAAALALAMKDDRSAIPVLIPLLGDSEELVVRAVRAGLKSLSGQDFGPKGSTTAERSIAIAYWKAWWKGEEAARK